MARSRSALVLAVFSGLALTGAARATDYTYQYCLFDFTNYTSGFVFAGATAPTLTANAGNYQTFSGYGSTTTGVSGASEATAAIPSFGPAAATLSTVGMSNNYLAGAGFNGTKSAFTSGAFNANVFTQSISSPDIVTQVGLDTVTVVNDFRVRGLGPGNGWSQQAPQYSQGMQVSVPTTGFHNVVFSADWLITTQSVRDMQVQYTTDGIHYVNASNPQFLNAFGDPDTSAAVPYSNGYISAKASNAFLGTIKLDFTGVAGVDDNANFAIRLVGAYGRTNPMVDNASSWIQVPTNTTNAASGFLALSNGKIGNPLTLPGSPMYLSNDSATADDTKIYTNRAANLYGYNNASGNWRFANVSLTGTSTNAQSGGVANPNAADYVFSPQGGSRVVDYTASNFLKGSTQTALVSNNNLVFGDAGVGTVLFGTASQPAITANKITVSNSSGTYVFSNGVTGGVITGYATLNMTGTGTLVLKPVPASGPAGTGTNTFGGGVNVTAGTVQYFANSALGIGQLTLNGGTVQVSAPIVTASYTTTSANDLGFGTNGGTFSVDAGVTAAFTGKLNVVTPAQITNKLVKSGAGLLDIAGQTYFAPSGFQFGFGAGPANGTVQIDLPSGALNVYPAPEWSNATSGNVVITGNSKLTLIRTDRADANTGGNVVLSPGAVSAPGTTASITFTALASPTQNLVPGIVATHTTTLNTNNSALTAGAGQSLDLNMPVVIAAVSGGNPVSGTILIGADARSAADADVLNINASISGNGNVYFATTTTHDTGQAYQINGGSGLVNVNAPLMHTGSTYVSTNQPGAVRLNIDNALPTGTRLAFGDDLLAPSISVGALDLMGHTLTVGSIDLGPTGNTVYAGIVNSGTTTANLILSGSVTSTYSGGVGLPPAGTNNFLITPNTNINIGTTAGFSGTQTFSGSVSVTGTVSAQGGKIILGKSYLPVDAFGMALGTLAASGTGVVSLNANASGSQNAVAANVAAISVSGSGSIVVKPANRASNQQRVLITSQLSIVGGGFLDLGNGDAIIHGGSEAAVDAYVLAGLSGGSSGLSSHVGLGSSVAGTGSSTGTGTGSVIDLLATLGVVSNSDGQGGLLKGSFDGQVVTGSDLLIKYTYMGDTDLNGYVDAADLSNLLAGMHGGLTGWVNGDTNYDGTVDGVDLSNLLASLRGQGAVFGEGPGGGGAIPEPGTAWILAASGAALLRRRR